MLATAKYIGAGVACSGLIGANLDSLTLILKILGFTIILITLVIIALKGGRAFFEGLKTAANIATLIAAGAEAASAGNSRDDREDRKKQEAEDRKKQEAEDRKKQEAQEALEAEDRKKQTEAENSKKEENAKKVDSFQNNLKSSSVILG
jgi:hypothetical protein